MNHAPDLQPDADSRARTDPAEAGTGPQRAPGLLPAPRRRLLQTLSILPWQGGLTRAALALPVAVGLPAASLAATPACDPHREPTPRQTEGPYFTRQSPQRRSLLEDGVHGTRLVLSGVVRGLDCTPLAGVLLDFWQADGDGRYYNQDYRLRGHQFTDGEGRYRLETIVPGRYPGRTRHLHVKVQAPRGPVLTTQLYFPNESGNRTDPIFSAALLVSEVRDSQPDPAVNLQAGFDFAIRTA